MEGTIAITDHGWYEYLLNQLNIDEVNFWTPSSYWSFHAEAGSPFFFKLKAKYNYAICGFAFYTRYSALPDWLAWDAFQIKNGCPTFESMREKIAGIRKGINYRSSGAKNEIGCILLTQPVFFPKETWIKGPNNWPGPNLRPMKYDLSKGEGNRIWNECLARITSIKPPQINTNLQLVAEQTSRYGAPQTIQPRLGQGNFRVAVMEAYSRACAVTLEHSLPALEAAHIKSFNNEGPNEISNGILLRADLHKLFDKGYLTITSEYKLEVSPHLKLDYHNGKSYYPMHGNLINVPKLPSEAPSKEYIQWHNEKIYRAS
jgi:putative restriction endonuclease